MNISTISSTSTSSKSDLYGVLASSLCMIHCLATPLIFVVQASTTACSEIGPFWWRMMDYLFLVISIIAIHQSAQTTSSNWMPKAMYAGWGILAFMILNESLSLLPIPHILIYLPAFSLVFLHLYNRKYCQCKEAYCCAGTPSN